MKRLSVVLYMMCLLAACAKDNFQVEETYAVELGSKVSTEAKAYLAKDTDKEVLKGTVITFKKDKAYSVDKKSRSLKPTKGKYLPVGKYHATAVYDDEKESFVVEVITWVDTIGGAFSLHVWRKVTETFFQCKKGSAGNRRSAGYIEEKAERSQDMSIA